MAAAVDYTVLTVLLYTEKLGPCGGGGGAGTMDYYLKLCISRPQLEVESE